MPVIEPIPQLEATILDLARSKRDYLACLLDEPPTPENDSTIACTWSEMNALFEIGHLANSGISTAGAAELPAIEQQQAVLWHIRISRKGKR